jgi:hypothetical protein
MENATERALDKNAKSVKLRNNGKFVTIWSVHAFVSSWRNGWIDMRAMR